MTLDEFVKKYNGKQIEVAGSSNAMFQCVDAANLYIRDVLGFPIIEWTDAKDFPSKAGNKYDFIKDAPLTVPQVGDLVIWKTNHIAICLYAEVEIPWFTSFDQNWPTGSVCHKVDHTYTSILGWLHPKENMSNMYKGLDLSNPESMKKAVDTWKDVMDKLYVKASEYAQLESSTKTRIEEETKRHQEFKEKLSVKLGVAADEPKILENIAELLTKEENKVEVVEPGHSKLCRWLARLGL